MKFGVNYTPSHGWFHAWLDPDWDGIDNDLKQISELGMDMCASSRSGRICNLIALGSTRRAWRMCAAWCTSPASTVWMPMWTCSKGICPASTSCFMAGHLACGQHVHRCGLRCGRA